MFPTKYDETEQHTFLCEICMYKKCEGDNLIVKISNRSLWHPFNSKANQLF